MLQFPYKIYKSTLSCRRVSINREHFVISSFRPFLLIRNTLSLSLIMFLYSSIRYMTDPSHTKRSCVSTESLPYTRYERSVSAQARGMARRGRVRSTEAEYTCIWRSAQESIRKVRFDRDHTAAVAGRWTRV